MIRGLTGIVAVGVGLLVMPAASGGCSSAGGSNGGGPCCKLNGDAGPAVVVTCSCGGTFTGDGGSVSCTVQSGGATCSLSCTFNGTSYSLSGGMPVSTCGQ
jgi:hypothetical protein